MTYIDEAELNAIKGLLHYLNTNLDPAKGADITVVIDVEKWTDATDESDTIAGISFRDAAYQVEFRSVD